MTHPAFHVTKQHQRSASVLSLADADGDAAAPSPLAAPPCKLGSLQQFVPHDCDTSEMGASRFRCVHGAHRGWHPLRCEPRAGAGASCYCKANEVGLVACQQRPASLHTPCEAPQQTPAARPCPASRAPAHVALPCCSVRDVQRIGILDIRLFNTDRHAGNMLVRRPRSPASGGSAAKLDGSMLLDRQAYELIPIDHGFALPEALEPPYFEWQHWPQVGRVPSRGGCHWPALPVWDCWARRPLFAMTVTTGPAAASVAGPAPCTSGCPPPPPFLLTLLRPALCSLQAMLPFGREELDYIAALDAKADIRMLRTEVSAACWACLHICCRACLHIRGGAVNGEGSASELPAWLWPGPARCPRRLARAPHGCLLPPLCASRRSPRCVSSRCACSRCAPRCSRPAPPRGSPWPRLRAWSRGPSSAWRRSPRSWSASASTHGQRWRSCLMRSCRTAWRSGRSRKVRRLRRGREAATLRKFAPWQPASPADQQAH